MSSSYKKRLHDIIPGGAHTYSRGDDQFPSNAPSILKKGKGCRVWDADDKEYIDYGMGLRSVNIGYGDEEIAKAAYEEILNGNNLTRASITELKAAELLREMIPAAEMIKFAKHGSTVTTAAVKLARAYTGRKYVAVPIEHPFFSFDDWFIGTTVMSKGIPHEVSDLTLRFKYNDIASLQQLFEQYPNQIAAVMLEAATTVGPVSVNGDPKKNFLHQVKETCHKHGAVFILDEMITGFRWHLQGAQAYFDIEPDISTFGKAMANGFAVAALTGKREIMQIGGIENEGAERVFLTSTTHGAEMSALGAFIKTMEILKRENVIDHFWRYGDLLMKGINALARELGIEEHFYCEGFPCSPNYIAKDAKGKVSLAFRTLFSQEMVRQGILMPYIALSLAHKDSDLQQTLEGAKKALTTYKMALDEGIEKYLQSPVIKPVFRKFN